MESKGWYSVDNLESALCLHALCVVRRWDDQERELVDEKMTA